MRVYSCPCLMMALYKVATCNMFWALKVFSAINRKAADDNIARRMRIACRQTKAAETRLQYVICFFWPTSPHWAMASSFTRFLVHTLRRTTLGRTPLDVWSARRRDLYLTTHKDHNRQTSIGLSGQGISPRRGLYLTTHNTHDRQASISLLWTSDQSVAETSTWQHNTHNRQTSMSPLGFEPTISASERPQTYA